MRTITIGNRKEQWDVGPDFTIIRPLGTGSYGTVCQACHEPTKSIVAIKKVHELFDDKMDSKRILREIHLLQKLDHPNIVKLRDILDIKDPEDFSSIYLVMEYAQSDLQKLMKSAAYLDIDRIRKMTYHTLLGLRYMHSAGVLHRDIKPGNILINMDCSVRICDFGLGRAVAGIEGISLREMREGFKKIKQEKLGTSSPIGSPMEDTKKLGSPLSNEGKVKADTVFRISSQRKKAELEEKKKLTMELEDTKITRKAMKRKLSGHVVTRWYRAPEIILMEKDYGPAVDVWSLGCVFAELLSKMRGNANSSKQSSPLFLGTSCFPLSPNSEHSIKKGNFQYSSDDQLSKIFDVIGTPTSEDMAFVTDGKALEYLKGFAARLPVKLRTQYPAAGAEAIDLLGKMLTFNPFRRITVEDCLKHPFFTSVRDTELEAIATEEIKIGFEDDTELDMDKLRSEYLKIIGDYRKLRSEGKVIYK